MVCVDAVVVVNCHILHTCYSEPTHYNELELHAAGHDSKLNDFVTILFIKISKTFPTFAFLLDHALFSTTLKGIGKIVMIIPKLGQN